MSWTSAVVGLGRIGQGYDYASENPDLLMTHALGFARHPAYQLVGGVDSDAEARGRFEAKFRAPAFATVAELYRVIGPEVVSIGVPTPAHAAVFDEVFTASGARPPRAILCEKPIALRVRDAEKMVAVARERRCALLVNYMRRFDPGVRELRARVHEKAIGDIYKGVLWYSKGLLNNGSHLIDLLRYVLGEVTESEVVRSGRAWADTDPEPDVRIRFGEADVYFVAGREESFSICDLQLVGTRGCIQYLRGGVDIRITGTHDDPSLPGQGYQVLKEKSETVRDELYRYQWHVLEALDRHLKDGVPLASEGESALGTLRVVEKIFEERKVKNG